MQRTLALLITLLTVAFAPLAAHADATTDQRLQDSRRVLESFTQMSEQSIPTWLLERAYGIVVFPKVVKSALFIGGRGGRGVMAVRNPDGTWSNPVFVNIGGANIGFQFGLQQTELVLVLTSRKSVEGIAGGKFTLGADASVAGGPVGRTAAAATDATFSAQVLSYARSQGLFAGVSLDASVISVDDSTNAIAYGVPGILASQILEGTAGTPSDTAREFSTLLARTTNAADTAKPATPPTPDVPIAPGPKDGAAKTYPMEDPAPGAPPPE
jgi:lipid-binding SYLF domain-containing protein